MKYILNPLSFFKKESRLIIICLLLISYFFFNSYLPAQNKVSTSNLSLEIKPAQNIYFARKNFWKDFYVDVHTYTEEVTLTIKIALANNLHFYFRLTQAPYSSETYKLCIFFPYATQPTFNLITEKWEKTLSLDKELIFIRDKPLIAVAKDIDIELPRKTDVEIAMIDFTDDIDLEELLLFNGLVIPLNAFDKLSKEVQDKIISAQNLGLFVKKLKPGETIAQFLEVTRKSNTKVLRWQFNALAGLMKKILLEKSEINNIEPIFYLFCVTACFILFLTFIILITKWHFKYKSIFSKSFSFIIYFFIYLSINLSCFLLLQRNVNAFAATLKLNLLYPNENNYFQSTMYKIHKLSVRPIKMQFKEAQPTLFFSAQPDVDIKYFIDLNKNNLLLEVNTKENSTMKFTTISLNKQNLPIFSSVTSHDKINLIFYPVDQRISVFTNCSFNNSFFIRRISGAFELDRENRAVGLNNAELGVYAQLELKRLQEITDLFNTTYATLICMQGPLKDYTMNKNFVIKEKTRYVLLLYEYK